MVRMHIGTLLFLLGLLLFLPSMAMYSPSYGKEKRPISLLGLADVGGANHRLAVFTCRVYCTGVAPAVLGGILGPILGT
jgi:hypothetical protein